MQQIVINSKGYEAKIHEWRSSHDIDIIFNDGTIIKRTISKPKHSKLLKNQIFLLNEKRIHYKRNEKSYPRKGGIQKRI